MDFRKCDNCGNQINSYDNICQNCGNPLNQNISNNDNQENGIQKKKIPDILKNGIYIIIGFVLGITPLLFKEIKQLNKSNQENTNIVEDIETEDKTDNVIDNKQDEEIKNDEQEIDTNKKEEQNQENNQQQNENSNNNNPQNSNNNNSSNNNTNNNNISNKDITDNNPPKEEVSNEKNIIGIWIEDNNPDALIFTNDKILEIRTDINRIDTFNYKIDENYIILNQTKYIEYEIKDNTLYLNGSILKKQNENYKLPSIYYNHNAFYGTWKLESDTKVIKTEDGFEKTLNDEMIITEDNISGYGSCSGFGICNTYKINFNNTNPELYTNSLCYELVDKSTLKQIKCHSDLMVGYDGWEDETLHNIIYKKVN